MMSKPKFHSLFEIKEAFKKKEHDPKAIMKGSISFLHQAVKVRDQSVKQFLITLARTPTSSHKERFARARAIAWLKRYQDPNLLPLFVDLLLESKGMCQHETILALVELKDLRAAARSECGLGKLDAMAAQKKRVIKPHECYSS